jgi:hypothetical protein
MPIFPLLDQTETSLLSQLAESLIDHDKIGIHLLEINNLSKAPEQAKAFVKFQKTTNKISNFLGTMTLYRMKSW